MARRHCPARSDGARQPWRPMTVLTPPSPRPSSRRRSSRRAGRGSRGSTAVNAVAREDDFAAARSVKPFGAVRPRRPTYPTAAAECACGCGSSWPRSPGAWRLRLRVLQTHVVAVIWLTFRKRIDFRRSRMRQHAGRRLIVVGGLERAPTRRRPSSASSDRSNSCSVHRRFRQWNGLFRSSSFAHSRTCGKTSVPSSSMHRRLSFWLTLPSPAPRRP